MGSGPRGKARMTTGFAQDDYIRSLEERIAELEYWLRWCLDNVTIAQNTTSGLMPQRKC